MARQPRVQAPGLNVGSAMLRRCAGWAGSGATLTGVSAPRVRVKVARRATSEKPSTAWVGEPVTVLPSAGMELVRCACAPAVVAAPAHSSAAQMQFLSMEYPSKNERERQQFATGGFPAGTRAAAQGLAGRPGFHRRDPRGAGGAGD